jgi:molybdate transport repressor ModE-like protein
VEALSHNLRRVTGVRFGEEDIDIGESSSARNAPVREPEVVELRAFCAAASLGSIGEAARTMGVSQPAMSKRLRQLENVVGERLLERSPRGVTLTPAGVRLYAAAKQLLASADTVKAVIEREVELVNPVRIASSPTIAELRLPQLLAELAGRRNGLAAELVTANSAFSRELVHEGRCDLGIVALDAYVPAYDGLEERVIWHDEVVALVPEGHPWAGYAEIPLAELAHTAVVQRDPWSSAGRIVTAALQELGFSRVPPTAAIGSTVALVATARAAGLPALLSLASANAYVGHGFVFRRVAGVRFEREFALIWNGSIHDLHGPVRSVARHIIDASFLDAHGVDMLGNGSPLGGADPDISFD